MWSLIVIGWLSVLGLFWCIIDGGTRKDKDGADFAEHEAQLEAQLERELLDA